KPTNSTTSASPAAASSSPANGPTKPSMTTAPNAAHSFGNSSKPSASTPPTAPGRAHTSGSDPHPLTLTFHPDPYYSFTPSPNDSDGKPNTPQRNSPPTAR